MVEPEPDEPVTTDAVDAVTGASYWSVHELSWDRCGAALAQEHAALLAPPVVVGATASGPGSGRHRRTD